MSRAPPPPVLDSARVLTYAHVDDVPYRKSGALWRGDTLVEAVPQLAICVNLGKDIGPMLFHCDEQWQVVGTSGAPTVELTKQLAERNYPGANARWIDVNTSLEEALEYYDSVSDTPRCSFCGKRPFEVSGIVGTHQTAICKSCVDEFHEAFQQLDGDDAAL